MNVNVNASRFPGNAVSGIAIQITAEVIRILILDGRSMSAAGSDASAPEAEALNASHMAIFRCPLPDSCQYSCSKHHFLTQHWRKCHERVHGPLEYFMRHEEAAAARAGAQEQRTSSSSSSCCAAASGGAEGVSSASSLVSTAMDHIDSMMFKYAQTDAQIGRAKDFAAACFTSLKPLLTDALRPHVRPSADVGQLVDPLLQVFDKLNSKRKEGQLRAERSATVHPPLRCHERLLGERPALKGKRKCRDGEMAYAWDTCLEELLEREIAYDPSLLAQLIISDQHWKVRAARLKESDKFAPDRTFEDICDGEVWQAHEVLGDPHYAGPLRLALKAYGDDIDIVNGLGQASGHHKLWIQTVTLINLPARSRQTLRAQFLSTVCLSSDFKAFGAHKVISGSGTLENSLGATCRRLWTGGIIRLPPDHGLPASLHVRAFLAVWAADGPAMGDICGTVTSFSKAINPCNRCEDLDRRDPEKLKPCGFLRCRCGDADEHRPGCSCHFRLRTPARDAARPSPSASAMQALGRVTLKHALVDIPGIHVATAGGKDAMHTLNEGRTSQLAACTLFKIVASGWATKEAVMRRASDFDWGPEARGLNRPNYVPEKIFTRTKVPQPDGSWAWGPHHDVALAGSAAAVATFALNAGEFLRPFIRTDCPAPDWLRAWQLHAAAFAMLLRYRFTFADLLTIEDHFVQSERLIQLIPEYADLWLPKAHWVLHLAHDIFLFGPARLLTTLLNEMKNAKFKAGAKRSNFHNPPKDVALFWAQQSDYELQTRSVLQSACRFSTTDVIVSGRANEFTDSVAVALLLKHKFITPTEMLEFFKLFTLHGVAMSRTGYVLFDTRVYYLSRIVRATDTSISDRAWIHLHEVAQCISVDTLGAYYVENVPIGDHLPSRLLHVSPMCEVTPVWSFPVGDRLYLVPKY